MLIKKIKPVFLLVVFYCGSMGWTLIGSSSAEKIKERDQLFNEIQQKEVERICALSEYDEARKRWQKFLEDIKEYRDQKITELVSDVHYQCNVAKIKNEIKQSCITHSENHELTQAECEQLLAVLDKKFFPESRP